MIDEKDKKINLIFLIHLFDEISFFHTANFEYFLNFFASMKELVPVVR